MIFLHVRQMIQVLIAFARASNEPVRVAKFGLPSGLEVFP